MALDNASIVRLKSGGPPMTVIAYDAVLGKYVCQWFDRNNQLEAGHFYEASLNVLTPSQPGGTVLVPADPREWKDY